MLQIKNIVIEKKQPLMNSLFDWTQLKKASFELEICQKKLPRWKNKKEKDKYLRTVGQLQKYVYNGNTRNK